MTKRKSKVAVPAGTDTAPEVRAHAALDSKPEAEAGPADAGGGPHQQAYETGRAALSRLCENTKRDWLNWKLVMRALEAARSEAMKIAGTNKPEGKAYCKALSKILKREQLGTDKIDSKTRGELFKILKHLPDIETFIKTHDSLNHPSAILRNWRKTSAGRDAYDRERRQMPKKRTEATVLRENEQLKERIKEVEEERDQLQREITRGFDELGSALKALIRGPRPKIEDLTELSYDEVAEYTDHIDKLNNERERSVKQGSIN